MKLCSRSIPFALILCVAILPLQAGPARCAEMITLVPSSETLSQGEILTVEVQIENAVDVYGYQVDVKYDGGLAKFVDAEVGPFLDTGGAGAFFVPAAPKPYTKETGFRAKNRKTERPKKTKTKQMVVTLAGSRLGRVVGASGSGTLARLTFQGTEKAGKGKPFKKLKVQVVPGSVLIASSP